MKCPSSLVRIVLVSTALLAGGCTSNSEEVARLASVCQVRPCICVSETKMVWQAPDDEQVRFHDDGSAYCPPGFLIRLNEKRHRWQ